MRRSRANLPNRCCRQIDRIAYRAFDGKQWMDREGRAATTRNTYCVNLLWQSRPCWHSSAANHTYAANSLNQYTEISDSALSASPRETFTPQFDDDGNQTRIKTATGIWQVQYNGENRPILWENVSTNSPTPNSTTPPLISMSYDRMGRRVTKNAQRFVYDGYLQIANFEHQTSNIKLQTFIWDPTEPITTRPLAWTHGNSVAYYTHDGNKNVSEVAVSKGAIAAHYEYAPFGFVTAHNGDASSANPFRFSSEYADDALGLVYYNYRHYEPIMGRWLGRDKRNEQYSTMLYSFCDNDAGNLDSLGMKIVFSLKNFSSDKEPPRFYEGVYDFTPEAADEMARLSKELGLPAGVPLTYTVQKQSVSVECEKKCNKWFYKKAHVTVWAQVHYYAKMLYGPEHGRPPFEWVQEKEMDHVRDVQEFAIQQQKDVDYPIPKHKGINKLEDFYWHHFEVELMKNSYSDEETCKRKNLKEVERAVNDAALYAAVESHIKWDASGKHTWHGK